MTGPGTPIRWAPRVRPELIRQLYEADARGIRDDELIDEVGCGLLTRCRSILEVTEAAHGRAKCHGCAGVIHHPARSGETLRCPACGWTSPWCDYQRSYQGKHLFGGAAIGEFEAYAREYPAARDARQRMLAIDRLLHAFHWNLTRRTGEMEATRPAAANLIDLPRLRDVVAFLDDLAGRRAR